MSIRLAQKNALKSKFGQHRLGAVIVKGGRVLSTGYNQRRPSAFLKQKTIHAEEHAILKLLKARRLADVAGSSIYVSRFTRGGNVGMACPCQRCMDLIRSVGISRIYYTTDFGTTEMIKL